jgi:6-phosphogluconolactonase
MLWVGTYQQKGGRGLYPVSVKDGAIELGPPEQRIANASFAVWNGRTRSAYFVDEQAGSVSAWGLVGASWEARGRQSTGGAQPCYLSLHPAGAALAAANYGDGSVALIELEPESGALGRLLQVRHATGQGPNRERQAGAHAHCALFSEDGDTLLHVDLGADRVFAYGLEGERLGEPELALEAPPGSGPRHLVLLPGGTRAVLLCELSAELHLLQRNDNRLAILDTIGTAPEPGSKDNLGGHLGLDPDGRILVTNRGHDSLVSFAITDGRLQRLGWTRTGGESPRHFQVGSAGVLVAHEESGELTLLAHPADSSASASPLARADLPGAVFILDTGD